MKYLFIFLPFFCLGQGGDSTLYGVRNDPMLVTGERFFLNGYGLHLAPPKPKVIESFKYLGAYYELRENGWYKEILPDTTPWHRLGEEFPDTCWRVMGNIRILKPGCSVNDHSGVESWQTEWKTCDQHIGKTESYQREKIDTSEVKLLVWTGCSLTEIKATKLTGYDRDEGNLYWDKQKNTLSATKVNFLFVYISEGKWVKPSHVIKEL